MNLFNSKRIFLILKRLSSSLVFVALRFLFKKKIFIGKSVFFRGFPSVYVARGAKIVIGDDVTINSSNYRYHINMHSRSKLLADRCGAKIIIGNNTRIHGACIHARELVSIGSYCLIAANCHIMDSSGHDVSFDDVFNRVNTCGNTSSVVIEDGVWIGANVIILPGVKIGFGSIISAGSIVMSDVPSMVIASGNPARVVKSYNVSS